MNQAALQQSTNEELLNKLEKAEVFASGLESEFWAIFQESWKRIHDEADRRLATCDPTDSLTIMKAQYAKRFYANVLQTTINQMHDLADLAYHEAQERGLINSFVEKVRGKLALYKRK